MKKKSQPVIGAGVHRSEISITVIIMTEPTMAATMVGLERFRGSGKG